MCASEVNKLVCVNWISHGGRQIYCAAKLQIAPLRVCSSLLGNFYLRTPLCSLSHLTLLAHHHFWNLSFLLTQPTAFFFPIHPSLSHLLPWNRDLFHVDSITPSPILTSACSPNPNLQWSLSPLLLRRFYEHIPPDCEITEARKSPEVEDANTSTHFRLDIKPRTNNIPSRY